ncbi:MAG: Npt1/Npt2 family nucleotide transporter [Planctomycetota bacterium]
MTAAHRLLRAREGELLPLMLAAAFFFCVLFGYFLIRPVREAMGVERGMSELQSLFYVTAGVSLLVAMGFGTLVHRFDRRRFIATGFRLVMLCLVVFAGVRLGFGEELKAATGRVFYVWLSVVNLFLTSVFWAFMADVWSLDQAKRLFPAIGVGGTLGAIAGSTVPWTLSERIASLAEQSTRLTGDQLSAAALMICAAVMLEAAVRFMRVLDRRVPVKQHDTRQASEGSSFDGVGLVDGVLLVARSPYLIGIGLYIGLIAVSSTLVYFTQAELVTDAEDELVGRIALFGKLDLLAQACTLAVQLFITARVIRWIGVGGTLAVLPAITVGGFAFLWLVSSRGDAEPWRVFAVFAVFQAVHRAGRYAVARPARETLFSVLSRDEKYKAKTVVDTFVYRGGDVAGTGLYSVLAGASALTVGSIAFAAAPLAAMWAMVGLGLAVGQSRLHARRNEQETAHVHSGSESRAGSDPREGDHA